MLGWLLLLPRGLQCAMYADASPWLAMYADEQQFSYHFIVFHKLFCIEVIKF
jgi:hypothetical protein